MAKRRMVVSVAVLAMVWVSNGIAGDLDSPAAPGDPGSAMYKLEDVYNRLDAGTPGAKRSGAFTEPGGAPGSTGRTVDEIMAKAPATNANAAVVGDVANGKVFWSLKDGAWGQQTGTAAISANPAPVPKTGQTTSYATGDDGDLETGVAWPSPRFTDNGNGTVTDNLTGLIWLKDADAGNGTETWADALTLCNSLANGQQGLSDGSSAGDWRLPTRFELECLLDLSQYTPALPSGHPFTRVRSAYYWSGTTSAANTGRAWDVTLSNGDLSNDGKTNAHYVWPVRGGE